MRRFIAAGIFLCLLSIPSHARQSADCVNVMTVSGLECVSRQQASAVPQTRHFGTYTKAPKAKATKVAGKVFTPSPVVSWNSSGAAWLADAQRYVGHRNPTARSNLWCARFVNDRLASAGVRGTGSDLAKSFLSMPRTFPRPGAIAVYHRGKGGHVAIVERVEGSTVTLVSGNCGRAGVCRYTRSVGSAIAYVWPSA